MVRPKNKPFNGLDIRYRGSLASTSWSLCVGAGVSVGLVPAWRELTRRVLNTAFSFSFNDEKFEEVIEHTKWSLDALLQGAANRLSLDGKTSVDFGKLLEDALYADLLAQARAADVDTALIDALNNPRWLRHKEIERLCLFFEQKYTTSTLVQLSQKLARANEQSKGPRAIINFNADTLLYALLDIFLIREHRARTMTMEHPRASFVMSLRGLPVRERDVIPIFHCHGAIAPPSAKGDKFRRRDSRDHLVFGEKEYLEMAGSAYTWAQALFLFHAQNLRLFIVGHSLADTNIRRWLGWCHDNSMKELSVLSSSPEFTPRHIWVTRRPKDDSIREIQEVSLLHLGVRTCWLDDWREIGAVLENLLAI